MKRWTKQRRAIHEILLRASGPLSVEEILAETSRIIPSINLSTVYRNLKSLLDEGAIQAHDLPGSSTRYQILNTRHTHHFLCEKCNRLFNIHFCPQELVSMVPVGFRMHSHSITLKGVCRECLQAQK
jgi:Fur family transcriptional regulator, ferric uptake regulator